MCDDNFQYIKLQFSHLKQKPKLKGYTIISNSSHSLDYAGSQDLRVNSQRYGTDTFILPPKSVSSANFVSRSQVNFLT